MFNSLCLSKQQPPESVASEFRSGAYSLAAQTLPFVVVICGSPGCGKSTLIQEMVKRLPSTLRMGVVFANAPLMDDDIARLTARCRRVTSVQSESLGCTRFNDLLDHLGADDLDLILIESSWNSSSDSAMAPVEAAHVSVLSAAAGHDQPARYPQRLRRADLVLLTKVDLMDVVSFDIAAFRREVAARSAAALQEVSARNGAGMDQWIQWIEAGVARHNRLGDSSAAAGRLESEKPEFYLG
ncbi:hypothetical protein BH09PLA1_BH09PLA1_15030 [soil metagenome]